LRAAKCRKKKKTQSSEKTFIWDMFHSIDLSHS